MMRKGFKTYLKHFLIFILMFSAYSAGVIVYGFNTLLVFIFVALFVYFVLFFLGAILRKGPLKYIGLGVLKDREEELEELKPPKQPWEQQPNKSLKNGTREEQRAP